MAIAISPAAQRLNDNPLLQQRLLRAVSKVAISCFRVQPPEDASLEPSRVLGAEFRRLGKRFTGKVYPEAGPEDQQGHCFGRAKGMHVWARDALAFLETALR